MSRKDQDPAGMMPNPDAPLAGEMLDDATLAQVNGGRILRQRPNKPRGKAALANVLSRIDDAARSKG